MEPRTIVLGRDRVTLPAEDAASLAERLQRAGVTRRDPSSGDVNCRSGSAALAHRLRKEETVELGGDEVGLLTGVLGRWLYEVGKENVPPAIRALRDTVVRAE
jgi:hypothetical protein